MLTSKHCSTIILLTSPLLIGVSIPCSFEPRPAPPQPIFFSSWCPLFDSSNRSWAVLPKPVLQLFNMFYSIEKKKNLYYITYPPKEGGVGLRWEDGGDGVGDLDGERLRRPRLGVCGGLFFLFVFRLIGLRGFGLRLRLLLK